MRIIRVKRLEKDYSSNRVLIGQFRLKYIRKREWYCIDFDVNTKIIIIMKTMRIMRIMRMMKKVWTE